MKRTCPNNRHYIPETAAEGERNSRDEAVEKDGKIVHGASDCPVWKRRAARLFRMGKLYRIPNPFLWKKEGAACIFPAIPFSRPVGFPCPVCPGMETRRAVPSFPHRFPIHRG